MQEPGVCQGLRNSLTIISNTWGSLGNWFTDVKIGPANRKRRPRHASVQEAAAPPARAARWGGVHGAAQTLRGATAAPAVPAPHPVHTSLSRCFLQGTCHSATCTFVPFCFLKTGFLPVIPVPLPRAENTACVGGGGAGRVWPAAALNCAYQAHTCTLGCGGALALGLTMQEGQEMTSKWAGRLRAGPPPGQAKAVLEGVRGRVFLYLLHIT